MSLIKRLSFANGYLSFDWSKAIFSDEACFWTGAKGRVWVRRPRGRWKALNFREEVRVRQGAQRQQGECHGIFHIRWSR